MKRKYNMGNRTKASEAEIEQYKMKKMQEWERELKEKKIEILKKFIGWPPIGMMGKYFEYPGVVMRILSDKRYTYTTIATYFIKK